MILFSSLEGAQLLEMIANSTSPYSKMPGVVFVCKPLKRSDTRPLLTTSMFSPLRQPAFFNNFKVELGGYAIV